MGGFLALSGIIDRINEWIGKSVSWLILAAVLVSATNAIVRKTVNFSSDTGIDMQWYLRSANSWLELQWYLFAAAFLGAAAYTLKQNEHIRIDILYGALSRRKQHWIDLLGHLFFLMPFVMLMLYFLLPYVMISVKSGEVSQNTGGLTIWPAKLLLLLGFVLLFFQGISEIIKKIAIMRGVIDDPAPFVSHHKAASVEGEDMAAAMDLETRK